MAIKTTRVTVGTTATRLGPAIGRAPYTAGPVLAVQALQPIWVGGADVTPGPPDHPGDGWYVAAGVPFSIDLSVNGEALYGVVAEGTSDVVVMQQGV